MESSCSWRNFFVEQLLNPIPSSNHVSKQSWEDEVTLSVNFGQFRLWPDFFQVRPIFRLNFWTTKGTGRVEALTWKKWDPKLGVPKGGAPKGSHFFFELSFVCAEGRCFQCCVFCILQTWQLRARKGPRSKATFRSLAKCEVVCVWDREAEFHSTTLQVASGAHQGQPRGGVGAQKRVLGLEAAISAMTASTRRLDVTLLKDSLVKAKRAKCVEAFGCPRSPTCNVGRRSWSTAQEVSIVLPRSTDWMLRYFS